MNWLFYILLAAVLWATHVTCIKFAGDRLHPALVTSVFYGFAILTTLIILYFSRSTVTVAPLAQSWKLLGAVIAAGVTIGLVDYLFVMGLSKGGPISLAGPLFSTVGLFLMALSGLVVFGEVLTLTKLAGFIAAMIGIFLMAS